MRRVVITGMGAVSPVGNCVSKSWESIKNGHCGIGAITKFDASDMKCSVAAEVKDFDAEGILGKAVARKTDAFTQYALAAADEAMEQSGIHGKVNSDLFGVYLGSGIGGIDTLCENDRSLLQKGARFVSPQFVPKMIINIAAGQLAIKYGAHGSALCLATACATGSNVIGEAYRAIKDGYLTAALAGGSEAAILPLTAAGFVNCMALSQASDPNLACLPFDRRRGGFVLGEGAAVMVLEEYEHALNRGAQIFAEIVGYGSTCDAHHVTAPEPNGTQTARAVTNALAGVDYSADSLYINAHGTGTPLNDKTETKAFKLALGDGAKKALISSTKSMTGHMLGAAGAMEAIICVLALKSGIIPPTINLDEPDPECDLFYVPNKAIEKKVETAISTSLGFGGHNACLAFKDIR